MVPGTGTNTGPGMGAGAGSSAASGPGIDPDPRDRPGTGAGDAGMTGGGADYSGGRHARADDLPGSDVPGDTGRGTPGDTVDHTGHPDEEPGIVDKMLGRTHRDEPRR